MRLPPVIAIENQLCRFMFFLFPVCFNQGPPGIPGPLGPVGPKVRILELPQKLYRSFGMEMVIYFFQCVMVIILFRVSDICSGLGGVEGRLH